MKSTFFAALGLAVLSQGALAADNNFSVQKLSSVPPQVSSLLKLVPKEHIVAADSLKWSNGDSEHYFIATQLGKRDGCNFYEVDMADKSVHQSAYSAAMCHFTGPVQLMDINQDGYADVLLPVKQEVYVSTDMKADKHFGLVFDKDKNNYFRSETAGGWMETFPQTKKYYRIDSGDFQDINYSEWFKVNG